MVRLDKSTIAIHRTARKIHRTATAAYKCHYNTLNHSSLHLHLHLHRWDLQLRLADANYAQSG